MCACRASCATPVGIRAPDQVTSRTAIRDFRKSLVRLHLCSSLRGGGPPRWSRFVTMRAQVVTGRGEVREGGPIPTLAEPLPYPRRCCGRIFAATTARSARARAPVGAAFRWEEGCRRRAGLVAPWSCTLRVARAAAAVSAAAGVPGQTAARHRAGEEESLPQSAYRSGKGWGWRTAGWGAYSGAERPTLCLATVVRPLSRTAPPFHP